MMALIVTALPPWSGITPKYMLILTNYVVMLIKSRSHMFLKTTSSKQRGQRYMLIETTCTDGIDCEYIIMFLKITSSKLRGQSYMLNETAWILTCLKTSNNLTGNHPSIIKAYELTTLTKVHPYTHQQSQIGLLVSCI